jgi:hypothetical protein
MNTGCILWERGDASSREEGLRLTVRACELGEASGCVNLSVMLTARGDRDQAERARERACRLGRTDACR